MQNLNNCFDWYISHKKNLTILGIASKQPMMKKWGELRITYDKVTSAFAKGHNVGLVLSDTDLIVDVDPRNFRDGINSLELLEKDLGIKLADIAPAVRTGSGGWHFYLSKPADFTVAETVPQYAGIEFKTAGHQVVCAGSVHPVTHKKYTWINQQKEQPQIDKLLDIIHKDTVVQSTAELIRNDQLADLLSQLPIQEFDTNDKWFPIMCASHHATAGNGIDEFIAWSMLDNRFHKFENEIRNRWESLGGKKVNYTVNTLYKAVLNYGGDVNRIVHDFDDIEPPADEPEETIIESDDTIIEPAETCSSIAVKLAEQLTAESPNADIIKAIKASIQSDAIDQIKAQKIIMKTAGLSRGELNKVIAQVKEKLIDDLGRTLANNTLKNRFCNGKTIIMNNNGQFWLYDGKYWQPVIKDYVGKIITEELDAMRARNAEIEIKENTIVNDAVSIIGRLSSTKDDALGLRKKPAPVLNCLNGELWLDKVTDGVVELKPHSPESHLIMLTNVKYDPEAKCPRYEKALAETFKNYKDKDDIIRHFYEFVGYILHPDKRPAHWFLLRGPGSDGKTTQMKIISALLGDAVVPDSIERYRTGAFSDSHATSELVGKLLVYDDDLNKNTVLPDGILKKLSEDGELTANPKGYQPFKFAKVCTVVMCCNGLPKTKDISRGFRRRAMVIPFDRGFTSAEIDNSLADYIIHNELSGVLNKAIEGLKRLKKRGYFQEPVSCVQAKERWLDGANPVSAFVRDCVEVTNWNTDYVLLPEMYNAFITYCHDQNYAKLLSKNEFSSTMDELGLPASKNSTHSKKFVGVKLKHASTNDFDEFAAAKTIDDGL